MTPRWLNGAAVLALLLAGWRARSSNGNPTPIADLLVRIIVTHPFLTAGAAGAVLTSVAMLVMISGVIPIKASSGHWAITAALLDFAKVRSVATQSLGIQSPPLDDPALVVRGAGHYETGCASCHGRPGLGVPPVMAAMTPTPPELIGRRISRWQPHQLFTIVKHGLKFTGMPAWPVQHRDDEVWAMVAFLRRMPALDATSYRMLVYGEPDAPPDGAANIPMPGEAQTPREVRETCGRCHRQDGTGRATGAFPSLAGQHSAYLYGSLRAFADRNRFSGIMSTIAANLSDQTMRDLAEYYERLPPRRGDASPDMPAIKRGEAIAARGLPDRDVPSCADCHGPAETPKNPAYPRLAGQYARYLTLQLELFKQRRRGGSEYSNLMHVFVDRLPAGQVRDVTLYYASLQAQPLDLADAAPPP